MSIESFLGLKSFSMQRQMGEAKSSGGGGGCSEAKKKGWHYTKVFFLAPFSGIFWHYTKVFFQHHSQVFYFAATFLRYLSNDWHHSSQLCEKIQMHLAIWKTYFALGKHIVCNLRKKFWSVGPKCESNWIRAPHCERCICRRSIFCYWNIHRFKIIIN